jgi:hypothetical protein
MFFRIWLAQSGSCVLFTPYRQYWRQICLWLVGRSVRICCCYLRYCLPWGLGHHQLIVHISPYRIRILMVWPWGPQFLICTLNLLQIHKHLAVTIYPLHSVRIGEVKFVILLLLYILGHIKILILVLLPCCLILLLLIETKDQRDHVQGTRSVFHSWDSRLWRSSSWLGSGHHGLAFNLKEIHYTEYNLFKSQILSDGVLGFWGFGV